MSKIKLQTYVNMLDAATELGIRVTLNIMYTDLFFDYWKAILNLRKKYGFDVRLGYLMPVGRAKALDDAMKKKNRFLEFNRKIGCEEKNRLLGYLAKLKTSCLHITAFPDGRLYLCCIQNKNSCFGDLNHSSFIDSYKNLKKSFVLNLIETTKWLFRRRNYFYRCDVCPLKVKK